MLKQISLKSDLFNKVIKSSLKSTYVEDINLYKKGYSDRLCIYFTEDSMVVRCSFLMEVLGEDICNKAGIGELSYEGACWKQVIVYRDTVCTDYTKPISISVTGTYATSYINKVLYKYYTLSEIESILNSHEAEYNKDLAQKHWSPLDSTPKEYWGKIIKWSNSYKYDINAAHTDALIELFPKAKNDLMKLYEKRHDNDNKFKKIINFYVGNLCNTGHRKTYNWIVQRTTKLLSKFELEVGGYMIYENTDGVIIQSPDKTPIDNKRIGGFKLEFCGDCYTYIDTNYNIIQTNDLTGSALNSVRHQIDLTKGKVVHYNKVRDEQLHTFVAENVTEEIIEIMEIK